MFDVRYDPVAHMVRLRMTGFWSVADVQRFAAELLATVGGIPEHRRNFDVMMETGTFAVQSQEVSDALAHIMAVADQMNRTGRKAIVVGTMMNKLQAQRALDRPNVRVFLKEEDASAWLAAPREEPA